LLGQSQYGQGRGDTVQKRAEYAAGGVPEYNPAQARAAARRAKPGTRAQARSAVVSVAPSANAWAAIIMSSEAGGLANAASGLPAPARQMVRRCAPRSRMCTRRYRADPVALILSH